MTVRVATLHEADGLPPRWLFQPRLTEPERRSQVVGYLAHAPVVRPGWRGDGEWVWPQGLADQVRRAGGGMPPDLLDRIATHDYLVTGTVPQTWLAKAAQAVAAPDQSTIDFCGALNDTGRLFTVADPDGRPGTLPMLLWEAADGSRRAYFGPYGWRPLTGGHSWPPGCLLGGDRLVELAPRQAGVIADRLVAAWFERFNIRDRESILPEPLRGPDTVIRVARTFDGEGPDHQAWFSPSRVRVLEPARRERLAAYLSAAEVVVRVTSKVADPLDPAGPAGVPLSMRTDGTWVWQEALAYYLLTRGVAPELELLCHIEERGYQPGQGVPVEARALAVRAVRAGPSPRPPRQEYDYFVQDRAAASAGGGGSGLDPDEPLLVRRTSAASQGCGRSQERGVEVFTAELRWRRLVPGVDPLGGVDALDGASPISEASAVQMVDQRWASKGRDGACGGCG